jgi:hypothetical protein
MAAPCSAHYTLRDDGMLEASPLPRVRAGRVRSGERLARPVAVKTRARLEGSACCQRFLRWLPYALPTSGSSPSTNGYSERWFGSPGRAPVGSQSRAPTLPRERWLPLHANGRGNAAYRSERSRVRRPPH